MGGRKGRGDSGGMMVPTSTGSTLAGWSPPSSEPKDASTRCATALLLSSSRNQERRSGPIRSQRIRAEGRSQRVRAGGKVGQRPDQAPQPQAAENPEDEKWAQKWGATMWDSMCRGKACKLTNDTQIVTPEQRGAGSRRYRRVGSKPGPPHALGETAESWLL